MLPIEYVNKFSYKRNVIIRNHIRELCKMNSIVWVAIYNLDWTVSILLTLPLFSLVVKIHDSVQQKKFDKLLMENRHKKYPE